MEQHPIKINKVQIRNPNRLPVFILMVAMYFGLTPKFRN